MSGYVTTGGIGNSLAEAQGTDVIPSSTGEVLWATFRQTVAENPASRAFRWIERNIEALPITMQPEEANERFGVEGRLSFDRPVSVNTARQLNEFHTNSAIREDIINRRAGGLSTGAVARFGAGFLAALTDPLNIASAFLPGVREARVAAALGITGATVGGRAAVRAIAGGSQGLVGAAALEPLNYWLAQDEQDDYTMGDVLLNLAFGTALGGVMHTGIGLVRDRRGQLPVWTPQQHEAALGQTVSAMAEGRPVEAAAAMHTGIGLVRDRRGQLPVWTPQQHEAALRQTVSAMAEGRPVEAAAAMQFVAARAAREELQSWYDATIRAARDAEDALGRATDAAAALDAPRARLLALRDDMEAVGRELAETRGRLADAGFDGNTRERMSEIEAELGQVISRARRAELEAERKLLLEGRDFQRDELEQARTQAEIKGIERVAQRAHLAMSLAERSLAEAERVQQRADRIFTSKSKALSAREEIMRDLAARTIRRLAARIGAAMDREEAAEIASRILRARPEEVATVLDDALRSITSRAAAGPYLPEDVIIEPGAIPLERAIRELRDAETEAEERLLASIRGSDDPADVAADQRAMAMKARAPQVDGDLAAQIAEATKQADELAATLRALDQQERAAATTPREPDPALVEADELAKEGEALAKAYEAAAVCSLRRT